MNIAMTKEEQYKLYQAEKEAAGIISVLNSGVAFRDSPPDVSMKTLLDLLDNLRVNAKYIMLDLEATRRELAKQLKDSRD